MRSCSSYLWTNREVDEHIGKIRSRRDLGYFLFGALCVAALWIMAGAQCERFDDVRETRVSAATPGFDD